MKKYKVAELHNRDIFEDSDCPISQVTFYDFVDYISRKIDQKKLTIKNFGSISIKRKPQKIGQKVGTKNKIIIPERNSIKIKFSNNLLKKIN